MEQLIINIGASADHFGAYAENCEGIYGAGDTPEEAKKNALEGLRLFVGTREKSELPKLLQGEYEITYRYDTQSLLNYYANIFKMPALERLTGINQKLLHHYATGLKRPRPLQREKIRTSLHRLGQELMTIEV